MGLMGIIKHRGIFDWATLYGVMSIARRSGKELC